MPEDIKKACEYAIIFLPGFLALGIAQHLSDFSIDEFQFVYLSISISVLIYALTSASFRFVSVKNANSRFVLRICLLYLSSALAGCLIARAYEEALLFRASQLLFSFDKSSPHRPLRLLMRHLKDCGQNRVDAGDSDRFPAFESYNRFTIKDGPTYEGKVFLFPTGLDEDEIFVSPACIVDPNAPTRVTRIDGPGVYIRLDSILTMEYH